MLILEKYIYKELKMGRIIKIEKDIRRTGSRLTARVKKKGKKFSKPLVLKGGKDVEKTNKKVSQ